MAGELSILEAILLGLVQGLAEWLPVSSSGHLVLTQHLAGLGSQLFLDLLLHVGTLVVILVFYRDTVRDVLGSIASAPRAHRDTGSIGEVWWEDPDRRLAVLIVIGSVPTVLIGVAFEGPFVALFESTLAVGIALIATGAWLFATRWAPEDDLASVGVTAALAIGTVQGLAIVPGVSRSGATIGAALLLGIHRAEAVRFSFLLSVPAILGATVFQADAAALGEAAGAWPAYLAGVAVAVVVGYGALWLVERIVEQRVFHRFAWYCWALGGIVVYLSVA